ncbi:AIG2-like family protein [Raphanus sativus]|nr:AIG2-like family protein [Raphanus sativus]
MKEIVNDPDAYGGSLENRCRLTLEDGEVHGKDNSENMTVKTYIWINKDDPDIRGEWDFEVFDPFVVNSYSVGNEEFIETFKEIMEWKRNPQGKGRDEFNNALLYAPSV